MQYNMEQLVPIVTIIYINYFGLMRWLYICVNGEYRGLNGYQGFSFSDAC